MWRVLRFTSCVLLPFSLWALLSSPCSRGPGSYTGLSLCSSTILKAETTSLSSFSINLSELLCYIYVDVLFFFFCMITKKDAFLLLFRYLNAIQTMCPHILRYLTTAVITNKDVRKRRQVLKDLVKVIQQVTVDKILLLQPNVNEVCSTWIVFFCCCFCPIGVLYI